MKKQNASSRVSYLTSVALSAAMFAVVFTTPAQEATIEVRADQVSHRLSRYLTGACIEDVNHEIYGGLYSQLIFGESFQEPVPVVPPRGFTAFGGGWRVNDGGELIAGGGDGPKLIANGPDFERGEAGVEIFLADRSAGNAGLVVKVGQAGVGADNFDGYEISLDAAAGLLRLGRHRHDWELLKDTPCEVPVNRWLALVVKVTGSTLEARVDGKSVIHYEDRQQPLRAGKVGLRLWRREARFRNLWVRTNDVVTPLAFERAAAEGMEVSGMWRGLQRGSALGKYGLETKGAFTGNQSQRLSLASGEGEFGIENQGLNRWGMNWTAGKPYEGYVWVRAEQPAELFAALESRDGSQRYAEIRLPVVPGGWQRLDFTLTPSNADTAGRFALKLKQPGAVVLGHVFLQPGDWGRFKGLPVRRDVAEALIDQGITVLRYGGSMVNHAEYRWKKMTGPRDRRPPHRGTWYPQSSNGWGIVDFVEFCRAAGFLAIPAFNMDETPRDMADFVEYMNGPAASAWGAKRVADGHPAPYALRYLELGNEERVDDAYFLKFQPLAEAIWAQDPRVTLVVGDFVYGRPILDPDHFTGAASGITNLSGQRKILALAKRHDREVWFDLHVGTDGPRPDSSFAGMFSFTDALTGIAEGARHKVVVFEFNAGNPAQRRALANALAINAIARDGRIPIATSANGLQPDGQNDNGWDQGLLFLNPAQVWLQPPGHVTRMISRHYQPLLVKCAAQSPGDVLDVAAQRDEAGRNLVLQVVNVSDQPVPASIRLTGFAPSRPVAAVETLSGPLDAVNTADHPSRVVPERSEWTHALSQGAARRSFAPHSFTILSFE